jgi:hypothetical protein
LLERVKAKRDERIYVVYTDVFCWIRGDHFSRGKSDKVFKITQEEIVCALLYVKKKIMRRMAHDFYLSL